MTVGLGFVKVVCDYVEGKSTKTLDEIADRICSKVHPCDADDFFAKIALFTSTNSRFQELKSNCEELYETNYRVIN